MTIISTENRNGVCLITIDNPPVNAISQAVRRGIVDAVSTVQDDPTIKAAVLHCAGRTFMAGADIKEFGKPSMPPLLPDVIKAIEDSNKPIIAAIHGQALGGGFEIALGCHYRIVDSKAKFGLPEVKLGIIPGAGGTQRLPRLIDVTDALPMITSGDPVDATTALSSGIVDVIASENLLEEAITLAEHHALSEFSDRRLSGRAVINATMVDLETWRSNLNKTQRGTKAPQYAVDAVEAAMTLTFEEGLKKERALFTELRESDQAAAMRHLFFAERQSTQIAKIEKSTLDRPLDFIGVIGAGTMGTGIAMAFMNSGYPVTLLEVSSDALERGMGMINKTYESSIKRGKMDKAEAKICLSHLTTTTRHEDLSECDLVIEAVFEDINVKQQVFEKLNDICKPETIFATNTSYLDVNDIAAFSGRPKNFVGLHFFSPANIMKLLEIIDAKDTSPEVLNTAIKLSKRLSKTGVISGVGFGFIGNRIYQAYQREAGLMLLEGATPRQVDSALYEFGLPMGPFSVADLTGIDIGYMMRQSVSPEFYEAPAFQVHDQLAESGRKGQKTGAGFYRYEDGSRTPIDDPVVAELIQQIATKGNVEQRAITSDEIIERCIYAMINEGGRLLDEGVALKASDIDVVFTNGYGFPRYRGGPMFYGSQIGLNIVLNKINELADQYGPRWWAASKALKKAAEEGKWSA